LIFNFFELLTLGIFTTIIIIIIIIIITFIGFGSQEGWITTDIKTYTTNNKAVSTHQPVR